MLRKEALTVAQKPSGLRFDIYERVHLPEGVAGIQELDEVELIPEIQVTPVGEQALLKGHLTLNSTYGSIHEGNTRSTELLQYQIPVEITLPMSRVKNIENISVEIENFDVDLLSARSLNVTGVLTLNGIETMSIADEDFDGEDEVLFVHDASNTSDEREADSPDGSSIEGIDDRVHAIENALSFDSEETSDSDALTGIRADAAENSTQEASAELAQTQGETEQRPAEAESNTAQETLAPEYHADSQLEGLDDEETDIEDEELVAMMDEVDEEVVDVSAAAAQVKEEKKEPKIAFGSKQSQEQSKSGSFQWTSWFRGEAEAQSQAADSTTDQAASLSTVAAEPDASATAASEAGGWKSFLLTNRNEQQFRKVRMCIVQKDETLDTIAARYAIKAKEIQLYNKLSGAEVSEGQVIYLPTAQ
jgi:stage VI sporulation protein D